MHTEKNVKKYETMMKIFRKKKYLYKTLVLRSRCFAFHSRICSFDTYIY